MTGTLQEPRVERRREVDLMRSVMVFGLILFHTARIFDLLPFNVKNDELSLAFTVLVGFVSQWGMPLFFLIAGIAARHALLSRSALRYVKDKFKRLVVPFIFGMLVIVPPLHYYTWRTNADYRDSYWHFYAKFFDPLVRFDFAWIVRESAHLWFLYYLFVFSMLLLPLFVYLKGEAGRRLSARLASFFQRPGAIFLLALPIIGIETFMVNEGSGGWNRYAYIPFLAYGYLIAADAGFEKAMYRHRKIALAAGILCMTAFFGVSVLSWQAGTDPSGEFSLIGILWRLFKSCCSWFWVVAILGWTHSYTQQLAQRQVKGSLTSGGAILDSQYQLEGPHHRGSTKGEKIRAYVTEAVLPFYIIHQTVIVVVGFYVVEWQAGVLAKYLIVVLATSAITLALFEIVRRTNITRFLFGLKTVKRETHTGESVDQKANEEGWSSPWRAA
jgi:surface polysaccharide O-acyltransferase-like enzyme